jgi:hypothetical protein
LAAVVEEAVTKVVLLVLVDIAFAPNAAKKKHIVQVKNVPQLNVLNVGMQ